MAFPSNCNPRVISVTGSQGCTLTRASVLGMTPQDFEDQGNKEVYMDQVIASAQEARMTGVQENSLEMLLMGRIRPLGKNELNTESVNNKSVILPFIYKQQRYNVNANAWRIVSGTATPGAGSNGIHPGSWDFTLGNHQGAFATNLPSIYKYFLPGRSILVETINTTTKVSYSLQYKVIASTASGSNAKVTAVPNYTEDGWNALSEGDKAKYQAAVGSVINLANAISDYESWGGQDPAENNRKLLNFWLQTTRVVHEYTDEYLLGLNAPLTSQYYKKFLNLPLTEQKRRQTQLARIAKLNSVFYGQRINENQTVEGYRNLPQVEDPNNPGCILEYKAQALGVKQQLLDCSRVTDLQGAALGMDALFSTSYSIKRAREADGTQVEVIDWMTNRHTAGRIHDIMIKFYKALGYGNIERFYQINQKLKFDDLIAFEYNIYDVPPQFGGFRLAVFWHPYFDDKLDQFDTAVQSRGATLWCIDWTDLTIGIAATASAKRETNVLDNLFNYIIKPNLKHIVMESETWTSILADPNRHFIIDNFDPMACPTVTVQGCDVSVNS